MKTDHDIKLGISLYSYQDHYYFKRLDLEGCLAAAAGAGAEGVEIFADAMMPEWPYVSDAFIDRYTGMMERYGLQTCCLDHFSDRAMWHDKQLTDEEMFQRGRMYIELAGRMKIPAIRVLHEEHLGPRSFGATLTTAPIIERLLPIAAENNVMLALECHNPTGVADPIQEKYLEMAERTGIPYVGLQADFSTYEYCMSTADVGMLSRRGIDREFLLEVRAAQRAAYAAKQPFDLDAFRPRIEAMHLDEHQNFELYYMCSVSGPYGGNPAFTYEKLKEYASKIVYVHGKFYDIDENGEVDSMDYPKIIGALKEGGYKGFICSEFEGNRRMNDAGWCDEIEYVRKHHILMRRCLGCQDWPEIGA